MYQLPGKMAKVTLEELGASIINVGFCQIYLIKLNK